MPELNAQELVRNALEKDELDLLLLGKPEYQYLPKWSPSPYNTDVATLLDVLYHLVGQYPRDQIRERLYGAIKKVVATYEGVYPVAGCILLESSAQSPVDLLGQANRQNAIGLPLEEIANELRASIERFKSRLAGDKSGDGWKWPDGLLGDLRRLSKNTKRLGGPSFWE
jgi:hypothetical protein